MTVLRQMTKSAVIVCTLSGLWLLASCTLSTSTTSPPEELQACEPPQGVQTVEEWDAEECEPGPESRMGAPDSSDLNEILEVLERNGLQVAGADLNQQISATLNVCVSLLGQASKSKIADRAGEWYVIGGKPIPRRTALEIIGVVDSQDWCRLGSAQRSS